MNKKVFLSYSRSNLLFAEQIRDCLAQAGHKAWLDQEEIRAGQEWWNVIISEIQECDVFVFLASRDSMSSPFCWAELKYALALQRTVIPVIVDRLSFDELPDQLRSRHSLLYRGEAGDKEELLRAVVEADAQAPRRGSSNSLPRPPRLPAALPAKDSAFLDSRFRADLEHIRQLIERQEWKEADERTRDAMLGLSGLAALKRGHLKTSGLGQENEVLDLPCDGLEALASTWSAADPPIDEESRTIPIYRAVPAKIEYPTVWVERNAKVETPLFDEMRALEDRCQACGVEPFLFYARPDGELLFIPKQILQRRLEELDSPAATSLLRFCSFLLSRWAEHSIEQLALGAGMIDEHLASFLLKYPDPADGLRSLLQDLWSRNLVRNFDGTSFNSHRCIDRYLQSQMDDTERGQWRESVFEVLEHLSRHIPVGDHWLKMEVEQQLKVPPSATEKAAVEALRNWLQPD